MAAVSDESIADAAQVASMSDVGVLDASYQLAVAALKNDMQLHPHNQQQHAALEWMEACDLAQSGVLLQTAVTASTTVSQPQPCWE